MGNTFFVGQKEHTIADKRCLECYAGYPMKCHCGGLIHCEFEKKTWDEQPIVKVKCDQCDENFKNTKFPRSKKSNGVNKVRKNTRDKRYGRNLSK